MECTPARRGLGTLIAAVAITGSGAAAAHPHMWINAKAQVQFDAQGRMTAVRQDWEFDEMFGAYATQGLKKAKDGSLPPAVLQSMADDWMKALGEPISHYFTRVTADDQLVPFGAPREARVRWDPKAGRLALAFTLPLARPLAPGKSGVQIDVYDPTYFVAYSFKQKGAVTLSGSPAACTAQYRPPRELDFATMQQLAAIPADPQALPEELFAITKGLTHRINVQC